MKTISNIWKLSRHDDLFNFCNLPLNLCGIWSRIGSRVNINNYIQPNDISRALLSLLYFLCFILTLCVLLRFKKKIFTWNAFLMKEWVSQCRAAMHTHVHILHGCDRGYEFASSRASPMRTVGPNVKNPPKIRFKKSREIGSS